MDAATPILNSIVIKRFRSIPAERVSFSNPTFFVGQNGSGKSNLVDVFSFLAEAMASPLQAVFDRRGGLSTVRNRSSGQSYPPNLGVAVQFNALNGDVVSGLYAFEVKAQPNYGFAVVRERCVLRRANGGLDWFDRHSREKPIFRSSQERIDPAVEANALVLPLVGGDSRFSPVFRALSAMRVYAIEPAKLREMQEPDSGTSLRSDGSNAASVLQEIERHSKPDYQRLCELLAQVVPNTMRVRSKKHGNRLTVEFTQKWSGANDDPARPAEKQVNFEAFSMSDGTLRILGLLTAVFQRPAPSVLVIEEPEATIHPGALGAVLDLLRLASEKMQVIVTTHSPELLDAKWIGDAHLRTVNWEHGATRVGTLSSASRQALQSHLMGAGELLRANALLPPPDLFASQDLTQLRLFDEEPL